MNRSRSILVAWLGMTVLMSLIAPTGCNIVGPAAYIIGGPPKKPAEFVLPDRPTVVVVDDRQNVVNPTPIRRVMADDISEQIIAKNLVSHVISPRQAMAAIAREDSYSEPMAMDTIAKAVGAEILIYVEMYAFTDSPDGVTPRPFAAGDVRVVDAANGVRLWPPSDQLSVRAGRQVTATLPPIDPMSTRSRAAATAVYEALGKQFAIEVTKLFYEHEIKELGGQLNPPGSVQ